MKTLDDSRTCGIYPLTEADRAAYETHMLGLDSAARRLRFGIALPDDTLLSVTRRLPLDGVSQGLFLWGELKGCVQVLPLGKPGQAELAVSVSPEMRGRGWGRILVDAALERACDRRFEQVEILYLRENVAMHRIARTLPGPSESESVDICKHVHLADLPGPDLFPV